MIQFCTKFINKMFIFLKILKHIDHYFSLGKCICQRDDVIKDFFKYNSLVPLDARYFTTTILNTIYLGPKGT